jgi:hypothetical protein
LATLYNSEPFIQADQEQEKTDELVNVAYSMFSKCFLRQNNYVSNCKPFVTHEIQPVPEED